MKIKLKTDGLSGEQLTFVEALNLRFADIDFPDDNKISLAVRASMGEMLTEEGKLKFDAKKLAEMLGDDEKGIRSILIKQGEAIAALQQNGGGEAKKSFRSELAGLMGDVKKVFERRNGTVKLNLRAAVVMATDNTIEGYDDLPEDLIESFSVGAFVEKRQPREWIFDIANRSTVAEIAEHKTWMEEGDTDGAFAIVEEGTLKPLVSMSLVRNASTYKKVAAKYVVTEEFAKFRRQAYAIIQRLIRQKLLRDYADILAVDLMAAAASYVGSALDGQYAADIVTDYHAIGAVAAQIEALNFVPDVLIMNPQDKWRIGLSSNKEGSFYLTIPVTDPSGQTRMMGFLLRTSTKIPVGNFILGESSLWEIEDESITVRMGYGINVVKTDGVITDVESDVDHNRFRVIVENYFHNYIASNNVGSFVYAEFATVKAALETT